MDLHYRGEGGWYAGLWASSARRLNLYSTSAELDRTVLDQDSYARATRRLIQDLDLDLGEIDESSSDDNQSQGEDYFNFAEIVKRVVEDARYEAAAKNLEVRLSIEQADENFEWIALGSGREPSAT